jgi:hypothetical protein
MLRVPLILLVWTIATLGSASLHAATAYYSPSEGVVSFAELYGVSFLSLESASGMLIPPVIPPPTGIEYLPSGNAANELQWTLDEVSNLSFTPGVIVQPNTLLSDLTMNYTVGDTPATRGFIVIIPEPSTIALTSIALLSLAALRRRK